MKYLRMAQRCRNVGLVKDCAFKCVCNLCLEFVLELDVNGMLEKRFLMRIFVRK
jgi:hypothetical protein